MTEPDLTLRRAFARRSVVRWLAVAGGTLAAGIAIGALALTGPATPALPETAAAASTPTRAPAPSRTPSPTPTPECMPTSGTLRVPSVGIKGKIIEYTAEQAKAAGGVDPDRMDQIAWYSGVPGGTLAATAPNTLYLYGHSNVGPAVFNDLRKLKPGATAVVRNDCGQTVTFTMTEPVFTIGKPDLVSDPRITHAEAGRLLLISCYRPDGYDPQAVTVDNVVAVLKRIDS